MSVSQTEENTVSFPAAVFLSRLSNTQGKSWWIQLSASLL